MAHFIYQEVGMQDFLTVDELAEKLKVPKSWVYSRTRETGPYFGKY